MKFKQTLIVFFLCSITSISYSQLTEDLVMISTESPSPELLKKHPSFYSIYNYEALNSKVLRSVYFGDYTSFNVPTVFIRERKFIFINQGALLSNTNPQFGTLATWNLYQSLGVLQYFNDSTNLDSLQYFISRNNYALRKALNLARKSGNCEVLKAGISNLNYLLKADNQDYQCKAAKEIVRDWSYSLFTDFVNDCTTKTEEVLPNEQRTASPLKEQQQELLNVRQQRVDQAFNELRGIQDEFTGVISYFDRKVFPDKVEEGVGLFASILRTKQDKYLLGFTVYRKLSANIWPSSKIVSIYIKTADSVFAFKNIKIHGNDTRMAYFNSRSDDNYSEKNYQVLKRIVKHQFCSIRIETDAGKHDESLSKKAIARIQTIIEAWEALHSITD